ncbi:flavin reductase like domain-containing protein [Ampelomyces quisqualis]|uniref:Flavin reductase like domain-containing protein n=1 Tax=Ampelomyces quisqualis TaxID=50730 RepID=A0A6A5QY17_AMPQU|nr:flavin reductase like domain-containing protein [Ampelomyces quisqualis]
MALSQRPASRFFAAFYRWNRHSQLQQACAYSSIYARHSSQLPLRPHARHLHANRLLYQQNQSQIPQDEESHVYEFLHNEENPAVQGSSDKAPMDFTPNEATPHPTDNPERADTDALKLQDDVRLVMRSVPSSVAVITVASYDTELKKNVPMGVAVSSLSTVSLNPPTITFNLKEPSKTLDAIRASGGSFRVHYPMANRGGATMVDLFSRGNHADAYGMRNKELNIVVSGSRSLAGSRQTSASRTPKIMGRFVRAAMECTVTQELSVADHVLLIAKVDAIENHEPRQQSIMYVNGSYVRRDGTKIIHHQGADALTRSTEDTWSVWDSDLFPGETERREYARRIKSMLKEDRALLRHSGRTHRKLEGSLPLSPSAWGINLTRLVDECRKESGLPVESPAHLHEIPVLSDFYGRLTPAARSRIIDRAKRLVKMNPQFLDLNFKALLQHLGISPSCRDLLPSDIAAPLRAEGLMGEFLPREGASSGEQTDHTLQYLEQVEHRLIEACAAMGHEQTASRLLEQIVTSIGEQQPIAVYFKKSRARLYAAAAPSLYSSSNIDIAGEVSPEEARVVMSRLVHKLQVDSFATFQRAIKLEPNELLRLVRVHPCISGFDVEFFLGKIYHLYTTTGRSSELNFRIQEMLKPGFASLVTWSSLEERVKSFVHNMPMQAMSWSIRDMLAAMGLAWGCVLDVPISANKQPLNNGHIVHTLVAKELKGLYGNSTDELNDAIATFLEKQYGFDVRSKLPSTSPAEAMTQSSSDDIRDAMLANRNVDVPRFRIRADPPPGPKGSVTT